MSEFPWETKKDSNKESSSKMNPGMDSPITSGAAPNISNLLANAFAEDSMEEVQLEVPSFLSEKSDETSVVLPPFLETLNNAVDSNAISGDIIPAFASQSPVVNQVQEDVVPVSKPPVFDISSISQNVSNSPNPQLPENSVRKSPPPLFNPVFLEDEGPINDLGAVSIPEFENTELPQSSSFEAKTSVDSPFISAPSSMDNPFPPAHAPVSSPLPPASGPVDSPFPSASGPVGNPFPPSPGPVDGPFPPTPGPVDGPFPPAPGPVGGPFPPSSGGDGPFPGAAPVKDGPLESSNLIMSSIKIEGIVKNLDGMGIALKSLFRSLTRGKSLIDRMQDFQDDAVPGGQNEPSPFDSRSKVVDPFSNIGSPVSPTDNPFADALPAQPQVQSQAYNGTKDTVEDSRNDPIPETFDSDSIRKITPIEEPLFEVQDEYKIDGMLSSGPDGSAPITVGALDGGIISSLSDNPLGENGINAGMGIDGIRDNKTIPDVGDNAVLENDSISVLSEIPGKDTAALSNFANPISKQDIEFVKDISVDVQDVKLRLEFALSRFEDIEGNVSSLSDTVSDMGSVLSRGEKDAELLSSANVNLELLGEKVVSIEENIGDIESTLHVIKSDKESMRSDFSRIEESIAELVNSYTALLVQVHESSETSELRISKLEKSIDALGQFEERFARIESVQGGYTSTSRELAKSISSLVDEFGRSSSEVESLKVNSEQKVNELAKSISSVTEYLDSELKRLGGNSYKGFGHNVHLSNIIKNSSNMKLCMEWLEFLMGLVGRNNLSEILSYYEELGWLTEEVKMELMHYADGIDFYMEKPDWKLTPDDHIKSIWFIESLAGIKVDKNRLSVIDRDIEKVKKGAEIYGI
ncbi:FlaD/FlaE family flagellar protein [Methanolobus sp. ZRKC3]|uniref:FlaD/FlaE family flagellar protein n=1 Tax=Methanolobus sp. ZRKC3 TaxID=3125786 RepID=UPI003251FD58